MSLYKVIVRGGLITEKGKPNVPQGGSVEMSDEAAESLPEGTVELAKKPATPAKPEGK